MNAPARYVPAGLPCPRCEGQVLSGGDGLLCLACGYRLDAPLPNFITETAMQEKTREPWHRKVRL